MSIWAKQDGVDVEMFQHEDGSWHIRIEVAGMPTLTQGFGRVITDQMARQSRDFKSWSRNLDTRIEDLEMSVRSANCMAKANMRYIGELVQRTKAELLKTRNFGRKSLREIEAILADMGLSLDMNIPWWEVPTASPAP